MYVHTRKYSDTTNVRTPVHGRTSVSRARGIALRIGARADVGKKNHKNDRGRVVG